jgi:1-acyl-sn-glycerol-3-phosphate acyltransferase
MIAALCKLILKLIGWRIPSELPGADRYVLIGYPHTSNVDFFIAMLAKGALGLKFHFVAKHTLFWWPLSSILRALGGIPVDRRSSNGFIGQLVQRFEKARESNEPLVVGMMPEGTRSYREFWRSGFYYLAGEAGVPLVAGYIDYKTKTLGWGPLTQLSGNPEQDLAQLNEFYAVIQGKFPEKAAPIRFRSAVERRG